MATSENDIKNAVALLLARHGSLTTTEVKRYHKPYPLSKARICLCLCLDCEGLTLGSLLSILLAS